MGFDPSNLTRGEFALIQSKGALPHPKEGDHFLHPQEPRRTHFHAVPLGLH